MVIILADIVGNIPPLEVEKTLRSISNFIESSLIQSNTQGLVIGLSGGLDSSTTAMLCAQVVNKDKILGLILPSNTTSKTDVDDAVELARDLGIKYKIIDIDPLLEPVQGVCRNSTNNEHYKMAGANLKARMRMMLLYYHANALNRLVVGTGNLTELLIGYFTKYGDGGVDILPIGALYKTDVRKIARYIGVPEKILDKEPTAGLWAGQTDEKDLGIKYILLDELLYLLVDKGMKEEDIASEYGISLREVVRIRMMVHQAEHKLQTPPVAEIQRE